MKRRFGFLGFAAAVTQIIGVLGFIGGIVVIVISVISPNDAAGISFGLSQGLSFVISSLLLIAVGGVIDLLREIEYNTRRNAAYTGYLLRRQRARRAELQAAQIQRSQRRAAEREQRAQAPSTSGDPEARG